MNTPEDKTNIALLGFMGSGKTTAGKRLARRLHRQFLDTDRMIEELLGLTVREIFRKYGEARFRGEEALLISKMAAATRHAVIATGGGVVLNPQNIENLKRSSWLILLDPPLELLLKRLTGKKNRPLLSTGPDPATTAARLLVQRQPLYRAAAEIVIPVEAGENADDTVAKIIHQLQMRGIIYADNHHR
ncbi:MAG: shikimate kinase [Desulfurispora sp.]|uniref:shikimate kinase n=1 Tax=Desulfurispora sp. TaxID=3014275 RepID=UPI00404A5087